MSVRWEILVQKRHDLPLEHFEWFDGTQEQMYVHCRMLNEVMGWGVKSVPHQKVGCCTLQSVALTLSVLIPGLLVWVWRKVR